MNRRRSAVIAAQAIVVGLVALIVALTLLQPGDDDPLFGVSTPEEAGRVELRQNQPQRGDRPDGESDRNGEGGEGREGSERPGLGFVGPSASGTGAAGTPGGLFGAPTTAGSIPAPAGVPSPGEGGEGGKDDEDSPTGDQYADALARLSAKLD